MRNVVGNRIDDPEGVDVDMGMVREPEGQLWVTALTHLGQYVQSVESRMLTARRNVRKADRPRMQLEAKRQVKAAREELERELAWVTDPDSTFWVACEYVRPVTGVGVSRMRAVLTEQIERAGFRVKAATDYVNGMANRIDGCRRRGGHDWGGWGAWTPKIVKVKAGGSHPAREELWETRLRKCEKCNGEGLEERRQRRGA